jgi:hypothetical protein
MKEDDMSVSWSARLGLVVLALGFVYGGFNLADAGGPPNQMVTVANSTANPVPVQQQGTSTVRVDPATVVQTSAADNPAFQPVLLYQANCGGDLYTVPSGKELVVDDVSFHADFATDANGGVVVFHGSTIVFDLWVPMTSSDPAQGEFAGSEQTQFYVDPGDRLNMFFDEGGSDSIMDCSVAGHLVDLP